MFVVKRFLSLPPVLPCSIPSRHGTTRARPRPPLPSQPIFHLPCRNVRNVCSLAFLLQGVPCSSEEVSLHALYRIAEHPPKFSVSLYLRSNLRDERMNVVYLSGSPPVRSPLSALRHFRSSHHICQPPSSRVASNYYSRQQAHSLRTRFHFRRSGLSLSYYASRFPPPSRTIALLFRGAKLITVRFIRAEEMAR